MKNTRGFMKVILNKYSTIIKLFLLILGILVVTTIFLLIADHHYEYFDLLKSNSDSKQAIDNIEAFHAIGIIILTAFLIFVAWFQLHAINETARADFLMRIDDRYGSEPIIKARKIIHRLYHLAKIDTHSKEERDEILANKIKDMHEDKNCHKDFIQLLNLLDFLETIAYFSNKRHIPSCEINELLGGSIVYFHKIFNPLIYHLRQHYGDNLSQPKYYSELDKLVLKINNDKK